MNIKEWLTQHSMFMNDPNFLAQIGHVLWGMFSVVCMAYLMEMKYALVMAGLDILYASVKEWWYDANYEIPKQTWKDNLLDFSMYCVGTVVGVAIVLLKELL